MNWQRASSRACLAAIAVVFASAAPASAAIVINEFESDAATDWVEVYNTGPGAVNIDNYVFKDDGNGNDVSGDNVTIQPGEFYGQDVKGLGNGDTVRLSNGASIIDSFRYVGHAQQTFGRCPDGTGAFHQTIAPTKGAANSCGPLADAWPGAATITDETAITLVGNNGTNLSGLAYQPSGTSAKGSIWAVRNGPSLLYHFTFDGAKWVTDAGRQMVYGYGGGVPDAEGVTLADGEPNTVYVATERDDPGPSRPAVLRFDTTQAAPLKPTGDWQLTDLTGLPPNEGLEAIAFVPDSMLVERGFRQADGTLYDPLAFPLHGEGLFFVGVEQSGAILAYALQANNVATRVATIASGFPKIMDLSYERDTTHLWAVCDDTCDGRTALLDIGADGKFAVSKTYERPAGMLNLNNEGFTLAPHAECVNGRKPVFYADDGATDTIVFRQGLLTCATAPPNPKPNPNPGGGGGGGGVTPQPTTTPTPTPTPQVDRTAPSLNVALKVTRKTGKLGVTTTLGEKSDLTIKVTARKNAKAKARTLLTSTRKGAATGKITFTLTLKKRVRAKLRKGETVTITVQARDAAGNVTTKTASAKVK